MDQQTSVATTNGSAPDARTSGPEGYASAYNEFQVEVYERRFIFPDQMDDDHIEAALKDGLLRLTVPKVPETGAKKIAVNAV
jgi:HSP20 family protein